MPEVTLSLPAAFALLALFLGIGAGTVFLAVRQQPEIIIPPTPTHTATVTPSPTVTATPVTPTATASPVPTYTPIPYLVRSGDTCISIAVAFNVSVQSIVLQNSLPAACDTLFENVTLLIPQPTFTPTPFPTATLSPAEATAAACAKVEYTVQENDTLSTIAQNYAVPIQSIKSWNGLVGDIVRSGQRLTIPLCEQFSLGPTPTATLPPPYPAPSLLLPADGAAFSSIDNVITLQWASVGNLSEGEFYIVTVEDITEGQGRKLVEYVTDTKFLVPTAFRPDGNMPHALRWTVGTVRRTGVDDNGLPVYEPAGAVSAARVFIWSGAAGATPAP